MEPVLIIDPGHGGEEIGSGSNANWIEKAINLQISHYQYKRFNELDIPVAMTRTTDETISKDERARRIRESGAKYCISNHINSGGRDGVDIIYSIYSEDTLSRIIAEELQLEGQNIRKVYSKSLPNNPKEDLHYLNRETENVQTTIIKYGFADSNQDDVIQLKKHWKNYAEAVVRAFCRYAGYQYIEPVSEEEDFIDFEPLEKEEGIVQVLQLPASETEWRIYPIGVKPTDGKEIGVIHPNKFNGLEYRILGTSYPNVYIIQTSNFGIVQIIAHPDSGAVLKPSKQ
ncbi:N-acetylmuramoyl-L-alanine amidase family protein [Radiobacillus deserti]|uniref:N-acetylmuramoyl-L-alanine amidase family protein n=1 Tax=Radiobacillus deserti TaxID=2594883 RepID=UPI0013159D23|nr:N-acetylmuramoyl-L-alanine amidase [Radiobacillus deserti]